MVITDYLKNYIGQEDSKSRLNFYINQFKKTKFLPPLLFSSSRGSGKTELAREIAKNLEDDTGKIKKYIEVNSASLKSIQDFLDDLVLPHIIGNQYVTILLDESHALNSRLTEWLLTAFNTEKDSKTSVSYNGQQYDFDFKYLSVITATTNPEKISQAFLSRFRRFDLKEYKNEEIAQILTKNLINKNYTVNLEDGLSLEIAGYARQTPREIVHISKDIRGYCEQNNNYEFTFKDWEFFRKIMGIKPFGLTNQEAEVLRCLQTRDSSLTYLAAKLKLDIQTLRRNIEPFLLNKNLMIIDQKRKITRQGIEILKEIENI